MKTPAYYKSKPNDIDRSLLTVIPEAPRVPQQGLPPGYDWNMFVEDAMFTNPNVTELHQVVTMFQEINDKKILRFLEQLYKKESIEL